MVLLQFIKFTVRSLWRILFGRSHVQNQVIFEIPEGLTDEELRQWLVEHNFSVPSAKWWAQVEMMYQLGRHYKADDTLPLPGSS